MISEPTFIKIGDRLINPAHIQFVDLYFDDDSQGVKDAVLILLLDEASLYFEGQEAGVLRRYFLHGSRAVDLNNLYWVEGQ